MTPETRDWLDGLRSHAAGLRPTGRLEDRPRAEVSAERALLAASLATWIDTELPGLLAARAVESARPGHPADGPVDPEPAIVITTTGAGIAAATELLDRDDPLMRMLRQRCACVTEMEYRRFCMRRPDDAFRLHMVHWSWMKTRVPRPWWPRFERWPLQPGERDWLHRTGTDGAGMEQRASHLWKWTGTTAALLKAFVDEGPRPG